MPGCLSRSRPTALRSTASLALCAFVSASALAAEPSLPVDPLNSPMWKEMAARLLTGGPIEFDSNVKVVVPSVVENQAQVPVTADARALSDVVKLVVFADLNPIQHVLTLTPSNVAPFVALRLKVEQSTPVRAAAQTSDGGWHVGGVWLEAAGGGCSAPAVGRKDENWFDTVGQAHGKMWREADGGTRARFRIRHPMDTGLAKDNTPAFYIEKIDIKGAGGEQLGNLQLFEPVGEDPTLTILMRGRSGDDSVNLDARDNNGGIYRSTLSTSGRQSSLAPDRTDARR